MKDDGMASIDILRAAVLPSFSCCGVGVEPRFECRKDFLRSSSLIFYSVEARKVCFLDATMRNGLISSSGNFIILATEARWIANVCLNVSRYRNSGVAISGANWLFSRLCRVTRAYPLL